jgi:RND family efflux transporter MFP subunit
MTPRVFLLTTICLHTTVALAGEPAVPEAEGILLPRNRVNLGLPVEARVREVRVEEGQSVRKGDALAVLYTESEELARDHAAAQLRKAEFTYRSKLKLKESNTVSEIEMVGAEADLDLAKIALKRAEADLRDKTLIAPWNGRVLRVLKSAGETVNRGEKVIELIDYSTIHVDVYLEAKFLTAVQQGQKACISGEAIGADPVGATVMMVDPVVEPGSGLSRVRLEMSNPGLRIPTGLPVKVQFGAPPSTAGK